MLHPDRGQGSVVSVSDGEAGRTKMEESVQDLDKMDDHACLLTAIGRNGDMSAFETIFRHFGPRIRSYMMKLCRDRQLAEELMQETMMMVWRKAELFDASRGSVSSWIFAVARNVRVDNFRKIHRPEFDPFDPAFTPSDIPAADDIVEAEEDADRLRDAMKGLPPEQLELLRLSFYEEASHGTIAKMLGIPVGTVKSRIRLAFARLRGALGERS